MIELSLTRAALPRGSDAEPNDSFSPTEPIPTDIANGRYGWIPDLRRDPLKRQGYANVVEKVAG
jgi:hypothetical protein